MEKNNKILKQFEIWSAVFTIIFGTLLHFAFEWSGGFKPLALIAAVNESTWEHLKLAFWPAFTFSVIAYFTFAKKQPNFCLAQAKKLFLMPVLIVIIFYASQLLMGDSLIVDIINFMVSVIIGHIVAYKLETAKKIWGMKILSSILIGLLLIAFSLFTYFPPKNFLFKDPVYGGYGIEK